jgi:hypothetical protein
MIRTFIRGLLWICLAASIYFVIKYQMFSSLILLFVLTIIVSQFRKRKEAPVLPSIPAINDLNAAARAEITEEEIKQFAIAISASFALGNIYLVEDQIEMKLDTGSDYGFDRRVNLHIGRLATVSQPRTTPLVAFEVFELLCNENYHEIDLEFLGLIKRFGWIGYSMGNLPPLSLRRIEDVCLDPEDRTKFAELISQQKVSLSTPSNLADVWNNSCSTLATFLKSNSGMDAIKSGEMYWLLAFD